MLDVIGIGTNSVDEVVVTQAGLLDVIATGKARVTARHLFSGGQTATAMCACAAWGLKCGYIGAFGSDSNGQMVRAELERRGVDTTHSVVGDGPNRTAVIVIDGSGRRTVLWHRADQISTASAKMDAASLDAKLVHIDDDDPVAAVRAASAAHDLKIPTTSDIEHVNDQTEMLIAAVTYPIFNEHLPIALTGETDPERALRKLRRLNPGVLCVTLGERGAAALEGDNFHRVRAFSVDVADNTGAGDTFRAGFVYGILKGFAVPDILAFATAAAAASCRKLGAIASVPSLSEIQQITATARSAL